MLNVHDLERRWLRHKIKSKASLVSSIVGGVVILSTAIVYLTSSDDTEAKENVLKIAQTEPLEVSKDTDKTLENPKEAQEVTIDAKADEAQELHNPEASSLVLKPSLHFMDSIEDDISPYLDAETPEQISTVVQTVPKQNHVVTENSAEKNVDRPQASQVKNAPLVTRSMKQDNSDLKDVIRRFKKNKNPVLGLFIAKRYYDAGEYQKSYNYALITNEIDKNIEDSWIIFSKSLVKLGQNTLAINTLKSYLKTSKSTKASTLLQKIQSGEFK